MVYFPTEPAEIETIFSDILDYADAPHVLSQEMDLWINATKAQLIHYGEPYSYMAKEINSISDAIHFRNFSESHFPAAYFVTVLRTAYHIKEWADLEVELVKAQLLNDEIPSEPSQELLQDIKELKLKVLAAASVVSFPLAERGTKFTGRKPGPLNLTKYLDSALWDILLRLSVDASFDDIMKAAEEEARNGSAVFQEIDWEDELIYIRNPKSGKEIIRTFKTIKNIIARIRKNIRNKK